jgi:hypothetical protein
VPKISHRQKYKATIERRVALTCWGFFLRRAGTGAQAGNLPQPLSAGLFLQVRGLQDEKPRRLDGAGAFLGHGHDRGLLVSAPSCE